MTFDYSMHRYQNNLQISMHPQLFSFKKVKPQPNSRAESSSLLIPTPQTLSKRQPTSLNLSNVNTAKKVYPPLRIMKCNLMKLQDIALSNETHPNATYIYEVICRITKTERQGKLFHLSCVDDTTSNTLFDIAILGGGSTKYKVNSKERHQQRWIRPQLIQYLQFESSFGKGTPYFKLIMRLQRVLDYQQIQSMEINPQYHTKVRFMVERMEKIIDSNEILFQMLEIIKANW